MILFSYNIKSGRFIAAFVICTDATHDFYMNIHVSTYCCFLIGRGEANLDNGRREIYYQGGPFCLLTMLLKFRKVDPYRKTALLLVHGYDPNKLCVLRMACPGSISEYFEPFTHCLFAAGYRPTESDKSKIAEFTSSHIHVDLPQNRPSCILCRVKHAQKVLEDCVKDKVKTLKQLCSLCMRSQLRRACQGRSVLNSITQLPIPEPLQDFVSLRVHLNEIPFNAV